MESSFWPPSLTSQFWHCPVPFHLDLYRIDDASDAVAGGLLDERQLEGVTLVEWAERLGEAIDRLRAENFDLVLLDFMLPDSEGLATFSTVRLQAPDVPVVALTGVSDEGVAVEAVRQGALDFLVKGQVQPAALKRAIRYALTCPRRIRPS